MDILSNPYRGGASVPDGLGDVPWPSIDAERPRKLLTRCPEAAETPLVAVPDLAARCGVADLWIKDERGRIGLGSFKALGVDYVIAHDAAWGDVTGKTYVAASADNHGLSVAAGARVFKARAVIYLARPVPEAFAERLRAQGAEVVRAGETYEESMDAAERAARENGWALLSDSSWLGYYDRPHRLMEGYLVVMAEAAEQVPLAPTHLILQAGVGGLAAACAAYARRVWGQAPRILVVEPEAAPALMASIRAGRVVDTEGPVSEMGRLDCKTPSLIALKGLARDANWFATISEEEGAAGAEVANEAGLETTASGAAGLAALLAARQHRESLGLSRASRVMLILSEGPE